MTPSHRGPDVNLTRGLLTATMRAATPSRLLGGERETRIVSGMEDTPMRREQTTVEDPQDTRASQGWLELPLSIVVGTCCGAMIGTCYGAVVDDRSSVSSSEMPDRSRFPYVGCSRQPSRPA